MIEALKYLLPFDTSTNILYDGEQNSLMSTVIIRLNLLLDKLELWAKNLDENIRRTVIDKKIMLALYSPRDEILKHYNRSIWIFI